jgi:hypothetical protein
MRSDDLDLFIKIFEGKDILLIICSIDSGAE